MLTNDEKKGIKAKLKDQIVQTEHSVKSLKEQCKPVAPDNSIGRITRMDAIHQKSIAEAMLRDAENSLRQLKDSFESLEDDDFGICVLCRKPIAAERILALPQVTKCINCA